MPTVLLKMLQFDVDELEFFLESAIDHTVQYVFMYHLFTHFFAKIFLV
jgi:hypothetical protein